MERLFRKAAFGGFNKEDVMQYIETMKTEFFEYKAQVEETIRELNEKLQALEQTALPEKPQAVVSPVLEGDPAMSINEATNHLKQVADELCEKMNRLIGSLPQEQADDQIAADHHEQATPQTPQTPDDKVDALLQNLFTNAADEKPQQSKPDKRAFSISDVLPAYLQ